MIKRAIPEDHPTPGEAYDRNADAPREVYEFARELAGASDFNEAQKMLHQRWLDHPEEFAASTQKDKGAPDLLWGYGPATNPARTVSAHIALYLNYEVPVSEITYFRGDKGVEKIRTVMHEAPITNMNVTQFGQYAEAMRTYDNERFLSILRARWLTNPSDWRQADPEVDPSADWIWDADGVHRFELIDHPGTAVWNRVRY